MELLSPTVLLVDGRLGPGASPCPAKMVAGERSYTERMQG